MGPFREQVSILTAHGERAEFPKLRGLLSHTPLHLQVSPVRIGAWEMGTRNR